MRKPSKLCCLGFMLLALACSAGQSAPPIAQSGSSPSVTQSIVLTGRVVDAAGILNAKQEAALSERLERLERKTAHQLVVVTVPTLGGAEVATFAQDLGNQWGIGRKKYNDGVLLLVAPNERKVRIAVGYGLEQRLTPEVCKQIIDKQILPRFVDGDLPGGIEDGASALISQLSLLSL